MKNWGEDQHLQNPSLVKWCLDEINKEVLVLKF